VGYTFTLAVVSAMFFQSAASLVPQFDRIARMAQGRVGAAVMLLDRGEPAGIGMDERFPMASVFKLPVAMAVLRQVDQAKLSLDQNILVQKTDFVPKGSYSVIRDQHPDGNAEISVRELLREMMVVSDGTACDVLLRMAGGPPAVAGYLKSIQVNDVVVAVSQKEMYGSPESQQRNWATPRGALNLLRALHQETSLSQTSRTLLLQLMAECRTGPKRIRGLLPPGAIVSHKTGSLGARATHDVGIVTLPDGRKMAIAVFVSESNAREAVREQVIAEIARAAWMHYSRP
jgi:beta-lactamase class A